MPPAGGTWMVTLLNFDHKIGTMKPTRVLARSYLPLPHVFERFMQFMSLIMGGRVGFYQGDPLKIVADCALALW